MRVDIHSHALINLTLFNKKLAQKKHKPPRFWNPFRNQIDLPRLEQARIDALSFTIYGILNPFPGWPGYFRQAQIQIQKFHRFLNESNGEMHFALNGASLARLVKQKKRAAFLSVEGAHVLERDINRLQYLKDRGVFYLTLTHFVPNGFANPCHTSMFTKGGISPLGKMLLRSMEKWNIIPDTAHLSDKSYHDFLNHYNGPILCTHTGSRQLRNIERNISDEVLREIPKRDGLVGVIAFPLYLTGKFRETTAAMAETAARFAEIVGPERVAIGTDFDGYIFGPKDMRDVTGWDNLSASLKKIGFSDNEVSGITGNNAIRFFSRHVH